MTIYSPITYDYQPSLAAAAIGVVVTAAFLCHQLVLYIRQKAWFFYLMVLCALLECIGFAARLGYITHPNQNSLVFLSAIIITNTPSLVAAACHLTFGRVLMYTFGTSEPTWKTFGLPLRAIAPVFVSLDLITLCIQLIGGSLICSVYNATSDSTSDELDLLSTGIQLMEWSSIAQIVYLGIFTLITVRFFTLHRVRENDWVDTEVYPGALVSVISISSTLLMLQNTYQVTEMSAALEGSEVYSRENEWVFWAVHALPIFLIFAAFGVVHPGKCLPSSSTRFYLDVSAIPITREQSPDLSYYSKFSPYMQEKEQKPLPPVPQSRYGARDSKTMRVTFLKRLTGDSWPLRPDRAKQRYEVSPYESHRSYQAFMRGAL